MKAPNFVILILCFTQIICNAQENGTDRKGRFLFTLGPEYRITPFYPFDTFSVDTGNFSAYTNIDNQNSGTALNVGVEYFITRNLGVGFTNSFRYDLVISEFRDIQGPFGVRQADYKLLMDYTLYLTYYFKVFKKSELYLEAGVAFMNRNSDFSVKMTDYDTDGNILAEGFTIANYNYSANKITIGYRKGIGKIYVGLYTTILAPYFDVTTRFNVPFIGCSFDIGKL